MGTMQDGSFSKLVSFPVVLRGPPRFLRLEGPGGFASGLKNTRLAALR
jgi:hypothetical protein